MLCRLFVRTLGLSPSVFVEVHILIFHWTLQPMAREYQNGDGFGYILAFRKKDTSSWTVVRVSHVESSRYVYYNDTLTPYSPFEVKIKAYNRRGEGPFSQIAVVYSAEEGESLCWLISHCTTPHSSRGSYCNIFMSTTTPLTLYCKATYSYFCYYNNIVIIMNSWDYFTFTTYSTVSVSYKSKSRI